MTKSLFFSLPIQAATSVLEFNSVEGIAGDHLKTNSTTLGRANNAFYQSEKNLFENVTRILEPTSRIVRDSASDCFKESQ